VRKSQAKRSSSPRNRLERSGAKVPYGADL
jgi:hypothetical protein